LRDRIRDGASVSAGGEIVSMDADARIDHASLDLNTQIDRLGATALRIRDERDALATALARVCDLIDEYLPIRADHPAVVAARAALAKAGVL
jgi:hypothetical protein